MNSLDIRRLVHRVIGGKGGFPPLGFPHDPWAADMVAKWTMMFVARADALTDRRRALFIRKLAVYVVRRGKSSLRDLDYLYGTNLFVAQPHLLETKLTFGGAATREAQRMAYVSRRASREQRDTSVADMKLPPAETPVVMVHEAYMLEELVHAHHLVEAGKIADNCLIRPVKDRILPNPLYWLSVKSGQRNLFAVRHHGRLCLLISIVGSGVTEMEFIRKPKDAHLVLPLVVDALQRRLGTLWPAHHNLPWPFPPEPPAPVFHDPNQLTFGFQEDDAHAA